MSANNKFELLRIAAGNDLEKATICELLRQAGLDRGLELSFTPPCIIATSKDGAVYTDFPATGEDEANITILDLRELVISNMPVAENLTERQRQVLTVVISLNQQGHKPYTWQIAKRLRSKGHLITDQQCAYDLGVIIRTKGTGVYSMKCDNNPKIWFYEAPKKEVAG